jgi:NAD+ diphosphatase
MNETQMSDISYFLIRCGNQVLISVDEAGREGFPQAIKTDFEPVADVVQIGYWNGSACYAVEIDNIPEHISGELRPVRSLFASAGPEVFALAGRGTQLIDWQKNHRFCGHCSTRTVMKKTEMALECPSCRLVAYPRISPAVMVLIERGDELMLARSPHFRPGVFSALAGFVEPGETLEQCAVREVREEVGLEIANIRYYTSQSWPFPNSLMIAFFADYAGGEITPDPSEIEAADWFSREALPPLPDHVSIARQLIDASCRIHTAQRLYTAQ